MDIIILPTSGPVNTLEIKQLTELLTEEEFDCMSPLTINDEYKRQAISKLYNKLTTEQWEKLADIAEKSPKQLTSFLGQ